MTRIYSVSFYEATVTLVSNLATLWTVPAGFVDVVRDIDGYCTSTGPGAAFLGDGALGRTLQIAVPAGTAFQWQGRQVWNAGQTLSIFSTITTFRLKISGYRLAV